MIKSNVKLFKGKFECLGENTEKYKTFSVLIKKELHNGKKIAYEKKYICSFIAHYQILLIIYLKDSTIIFA